MALTFIQPFAPAALTNAAATYYTVPASPTSSLLRNGRVRFTNTDSAAHTVTAYAIPSAGSASAANCIANAEAIAPNTHLDLDLPLMKAGDFLQAKADANTSVTIVILDAVLFS